MFPVSFKAARSYYLQEDSVPLYLWASGLWGRMKVVEGVIAKEVKWSTLCKRAGLYSTLWNMYTTCQVWNMHPGNNIVKQNSLKTLVTFLPIPVPHTRSPPKPQHQPTAELSPLSRPSYRPSTHAFTALSLSPFHFTLSLSLWSWLPFILLPHSGSTLDEKKGEWERKSKPPLFLALRQESQW